MASQQPFNPTANPQRKLRLAFFVTHPIQYFAPQLRRIAQEPDIDLKVFFHSDLSMRAYKDKEFGVQVKWDIPLVDGYAHEFLPSLLDSGRINFWRPLNYGIARRIREQGFDVVWAHGYANLTNLRAIFVASKSGIPVLIRTDSTLADRPRSKAKLALKAMFFHMLRKKISGVLSVGLANRQYWRHHLGEDVPSFPFNYAVDNAFFQNACREAAKSREEFRRSLGLEAGRPVILFAAKLVTRKRCADLLEAFLELSKASARETAPYLLIVGDGEERAALEQRAKEAQAEDVRFLGFRNQTELPRYYDLCDVFVLPSVDEPWGLAVNEVMNAGRAVIVSDEVGCQTDLVRHGVNGCVYKARDVAALTECLRTVLANDATWRRMGAESLRIIAGFDFEQNVRGLRQALSYLVPGFPAVTPSGQMV